MSSTEQLVQAAQEGETFAFAELVRRYERAVVITARSVTGDFHASQDAALFNYRCRRGIRVFVGDPHRILDIEDVQVMHNFPGVFVNAHSEKPMTVSCGCGQPHLIAPNDR